MQDSAREIRLSLGRPPSHATLEEAMQQVAMLKAAKEAQQTFPVRALSFYVTFDKVPNFILTPPNTS